LARHAPLSPEISQASQGAIESRIGYRFRDPALLAAALTHSSALGTGPSTHNERLEFLGDRVLGLLAAELLLDRFPDVPEGALAPRLNALVRREACAAVARAIELGPHIRSAGSGGALGAATLADACEALIAALYLDGGLEAARALFVREWAGAIDALDVLPHDAKSALQEWSQERSLGLPAYTLASQEGPDHGPMFTVEVSIGALAPAQGTGASKRAAEQAAAARLLVREGVWAEAAGAAFAKDRP
jgi:ribonuclease-3